MVLIYVCVREVDRINN